MTLSYTSVDRMLNAFPRIGEVSAITSAQLAAYATDAEALVNAWVAQRYTVPVSGNPPLLATLSTDLAIYRVLALRIFTSERMNESAWPDRYKDSMLLLERIAEGDAQIVTESGTLVDEGTIVADAAGAVWSSTMGYIPTFAEVPWGAEQVDANKVRDKLNERGDSGWGWRVR